MNAATPVLHAPPLSDAVQPNAPASAASATPRTGSQDFASAFRGAGGKPARKSAANKQQDPAPSGSSLPAAGNQPPPVVQPAPPPVKTDSLAAAVADAAASAKGAPGGAQGPVAGAIAAASTTEANAAGTTILSAANLDPGLPPAAAAPPGIAPAPAPAVGDDTTTASAADGATVPVSGPSMPHALSMRTLTVPGTSAAASGPAVATGNTGAAKPRDASANPGTTASANSAPSTAALNDSTASNGPAATGTDAAAQAAMAAAIAQGGANAPAPDSTFSDDLATSETDLPSGAAAVSAPTVGAPAAGAPAAALAQASAAAMSAAVTAATAASVAQALSAAASLSATDKRSHGNSTNATLAGASNDGGIGAAQLLTSNTSTDSVPMPTFKVAAGMDTAQFGQGVADRVALMMDGNLTSAKLQVNPPALGPIEVRIALQGGHAQVWLSSHSAVTRDALESSSSKLREMLGSQGFSQVSVDISQRSFQERSPQSQAYETAPSIGDDVPVSAQASLSMSRSANGLLDAYA